MITPLDGKQIEVCISNGHQYLGLPSPSPRQKPSLQVCNTCKDDQKDLASETEWNVVHTTFLATKSEDFNNGREVIAYKCEDVFGTPAFVLRSPLRTLPRGALGPKVLEFLLLPTETGFVCAMAYERRLGQLSEQLAEEIMKRINCWRRFFSPSLPPRSDTWRSLQ